MPAATPISSGMPSDSRCCCSARRRASARARRRRTTVRRRSTTSPARPKTRTRTATDRRVERRSSLTRRRGRHGRLRYRGHTPRSVDPDDRRGRQRRVGHHRWEMVQVRLGSDGGVEALVEQRGRGPVVVGRVEDDREHGATAPRRGTDERVPRELGRPRLQPVGAGIEIEEQVVIVEGVTETVAAGERVVRRVDDVDEIGPRQHRATDDGEIPR